MANILKHRERPPTSDNVLFHSETKRFIEKVNPDFFGFH
jgi:hypothetical protein